MTMFMLKVATTNGINDATSLKEADRIQTGMKLNGKDAVLFEGASAEDAARLPQAVSLMNEMAGLKAKLASKGVTFEGGIVASVRKGWLNVTLFKTEKVSKGLSADDLLGSIG